MKKELAGIIEIMTQQHGYDVDVALMERAFAMAGEFYAGRRRLSGEPLVVHPMAVAKITAELGMPPEAVIMALFHEADDSQVALVRQELGEETGRLVELMSRVRAIRPTGISPKNGESWRKYVIATAQDLRVLVTRIADRLDNLRTSDVLDEKAQVKLARECRHIYIPLSGRLGLQKVKSEMENRVFSILEPEEYATLQQQVSEFERKRKSYVQDVVVLLKELLEENGYHDFEVYGRPKHLFSIYRKLRDSGKSLEHIHDIIGFRVITETEAQCYGVLGLIHSRFRPVPGRFKDYIALPKPNGYQSLHTTIIGPRGRRIEIQIRTRWMHRIAEQGVAAHWLYKERHQKISKDDADKYRRLRHMFELTRRGGGQFWELEGFDDEVFVLTPMGDLVVLPKGATALDFAYAIHTQVGHRCTGVRVNGQMVPLRTELETGQVVEIMTSQNQEPRPDWLTMVRTEKARTKIRHHLRQVEREQARHRAYDLLEKELRKHRVSLSRIVKEGRLDEAAHQLRLSSADELLIALGENRIQMPKVLDILVPREEEPQSPPVESQLSSQIVPVAPKRGGAYVEVEGLSGILTRMAKCCAPAPGEQIVGYITRGKGVTIHSAQCPRLSALEPSRLVEAKWVFPGREGCPFVLRVLTDDRPGMLAAMSEAFARSGINIDKLNVTPVEGGATAAVFHCVAKEQTIAKLIRKLRNIKGVKSVSRMNDT